MNIKTKYKYPDIHGKFGQYGGRYVPETLMSALFDLEKCYNEAVKDFVFIQEYNQIQKD